MDQKEQNPNDSIVETKSVSGDHGELTWTISGDLLKDMKKAKNKQRFVGAPLRIGESNWRIEIYPNGWQNNHKDEGSFAVFIRNVSLAPKFKHFLICREIRCNELDIGEVFVKQYEHGIVNGWADYTMTLKQIQKYNNLSFSISIKILKQMMKFQDKIFYQRKIKIPPIYTFRWNINGSLLTKIQAAANGNQFCSPIYDGIWAVAIRPNGKSFGDKGYCRVTLKLCGLPSKVKEITVNWNVVAILRYKDEYKQDKKVDVDKTHTFDLLDKNQYNWGKKKLRFSELKKCKSLQIIIKTMVISQYDDKGNDIMADNTAKWDNHVQKHEEDDTKKAEISGMDEFHIMQMIDKKLEDFSSAKLREMEKMLTSKIAEITKISKDRFDSLESKMKTDIIQKIGKMEQEITNIATKKPENIGLSAKDKELISKAAKKTELEDALNQLADMKGQLKMVSNTQLKQNEDIRDLKSSTAAATAAAEKAAAQKPPSTTTTAPAASTAVSDDTIEALDGKIERVKKGLAQLVKIRKDITTLKEDTAAMEKEIKKLSEAESKSNGEELDKIKKEMKSLYRADKRLIKANQNTLDEMKIEMEKQSKVQNKMEMAMETMQSKMKKQDEVKKEDITKLSSGHDTMKQDMASLRKKLDKLAKMKGNDGLKADIDKMQQQLSMMTLQQNNLKDAASKQKEELYTAMKSRDDDIEANKKGIKENKDHLTDANAKLAGMKQDVEKLMKEQKSLSSEVSKVSKEKQKPAEKVDLGPLKKEIDGLKKDLSNLSASTKKENEAMSKQTEDKLTKLKEKNKANMTKITNAIEAAKNFNKMNLNSVKSEVENVKQTQKQQQQSLTKSVESNTKNIASLTEKQPKIDVDSLKTTVTLLQTQMADLQEEHEKVKRERSAQMEAMEQRHKLQQHLQEDDEKEETDDQRKIKKWFKETVRLPEYAQVFIDEGYQSLDSIAKCTDEQMKKMGIAKHGHRNTIHTFCSLLQPKVDSPKPVQPAPPPQFVEEQKAKKPVVTEKPKPKKKKKAKVVSEWVCDICGANNPGDSDMCTDCGVERE